MTVFCRGFLFLIIVFGYYCAHSDNGIRKTFGGAIVAGSGFILVGIEQVTDFFQLFIEDKGHQVGNHVQKNDSVNR